MAAERFSQRIGAALRAGDLPLAASLLAAAGPQREADAELLYWSGVLACREGDFAAGARWFEQAAALAPCIALFQHNLGMAQKAAGHPEAAVAALRRALALDPDSADSWAGLGEILSGLGAHDEAHGCFARAHAIDGINATWVKAAALHPAWHQPLVGRHVVLRRLDAGDAEFLAHWRSDAAFIRRYNRHLSIGPSVESLRETLREYSQRLPVEANSMDWLVLGKGGDGETRGVPLGLIGLTQINLHDRRADFNIGFPANAGDTSAQRLEAGLLVLGFAFATIGFNKLTTTVYGDNPLAQRTALGLGFVPEGVLRAHHRNPAGTYVDIHLNGLLANEYKANARIRKIAARLGVDY